MKRLFANFLIVFVVVIFSVPNKNLQGAQATPQQIQEMQSVLKNAEAQLIQMQKALEQKKIQPPAPPPPPKVVQPPVQKPAPTPKSVTLGSRYVKIVSVSRTLIEYRLYLFLLFPCLCSNYYLL
ncbi:MAG: hypothetical protein HZC45_05280 [Deltaproteobacteria bacterium]|nr:hypothetical protein [Deltaproteobacteria bacterium]